MTATMTSRRFLAGLLLGAGLLLALHSDSPADEPEAAAGAKKEPTAPAAEAPAPNEAAPAPTETDTPAKDSPSNEKMLLTAMEHNPDIRIARSQLRSAEAELNRTRLDVVRRVVTLRKSIEEYEPMIRSLKTLVAAARATARELWKPMTELASFQADLQYLLGKSDVPAQAAPADEGPKESVTIENLLLTAMENNPDILVAKAKVEEAKDELNRVQLDVARKLVTLPLSVEYQRGVVSQMRRLVAGKVVAPEEIGKVLVDLATVEADLQYVLGRPQFVLEQPQPEKANPK